MINPPTSMVTPHGTQTLIFTIVSVTLVAALVCGVVVWRRTGRPTMLLLTLGGLVCCLNEATVDVLGHCYFPVRGAWEGQTLFGRGIPLWVDLTYGTFFGAFPYGLAVLLQRGVSRARMWMAIIAFWVADLVLEIPLLGSHLYSYYGEQPFKIGGYPLAWMTINVLAVFMTAVIVARWEGEFRGRRLLLLLLVPLMTDVASLVSDLPAFWALSSNVATWLKYVAVAATMLIELYELDALIRFGRARPAGGEAGAAATSPSARSADRELQTA